MMKSRMITLPELAMVAMTRAAFGAGIGFLLADRFSDEQRRAVGWTLVAVGAISTIPLVAEVMLRHPETDQSVGSASRRPAWQAEGSTCRDMATSGL